MTKTLQIGATAALLALLLADATMARALDPSKSIQQYVRSSWTSADGLPENTVVGITQTRDGYLWFWTEEGVARFNGRQFTVFDQATTPGLRNNSITVLMADNQENALWIGTYLGGLTRYTGVSFAPIWWRMVFLTTMSLLLRKTAQEACGLAHLKGWRSCDQGS